MTSAAPQDFNQALIELRRDARDGRGLPVRLWPTAPLSGKFPPSAEELRNYTGRYFESMFGRDSDIISLGCSPYDAEAAAWNNLALLCRATAAAIEYEQGERKRC